MDLHLQIMTGTRLLYPAIGLIGILVAAGVGWATQPNHQFFFEHLANAFAKLVQTEKSMNIMSIGLLAPPRLNQQERLMSAIPFLSLALLAKDQDLPKADEEPMQLKSANSIKCESSSPPLSPTYLEPAAIVQSSAHMDCNPSPPMSNLGSPDTYGLPSIPPSENRIRETADEHQERCTTHYTPNPPPPDTACTIRGCIGALRINIGHRMFLSPQVLVTDFFDSPAVLEREANQRNKRSEKPQKYELEIELNDSGSMHEIYKGFCSLMNHVAACGSLARKVTRLRITVPKNFRFPLSPQLLNDTVLGDTHSGSAPLTPPRYNGQFPNLRELYWEGPNPSSRYIFPGPFHTFKNLPFCSLEIIELSHGLISESTCQHILKQAKLLRVFKAELYGSTSNSPRAATREGKEGSELDQHELPKLETLDLRSRNVAFANILAPLSAPCLKTLRLYSASRKLMKHRPWSPFVESLVKLEIDGNISPKSEKALLKLAAKGTVRVKRDGWPLRL